MFKTKTPMSAETPGQTETSLRLILPVSVAFRMHWLTEEASAFLEWRDARQTSTLNTTVDLAFSGPLSVEDSTDVDGWRHCILRKAPGELIDLNAIVPATPTTESREDLVATVLGLYHTTAVLMDEWERLYETLAPFVDRLWIGARPLLASRFLAGFRRCWDAAEPGDVLFDLSFPSNSIGDQQRIGFLSGEALHVFGSSADVAWLPAATDAALRETQTFDVHLPYLERRAWKTRLDTLPTSTIDSSSGDLRIIAGAQPSVAAGHLQQAAMTFASAIPSVSMVLPTGVPLTFQHRTTTSAALLRRTLDRTLAEYGVAERAENWLNAQGIEDAEPVSWQFNLRLSAAAMEAWANVPAERETRFFPVYKRVSQAVQRTLRRWLLTTYLNQTAPSGDLKKLPAMLFYTGTLPFIGSSKSQLSYDLLDRESMFFGERTGSRAFSSLITEARELLRRLGRPECAETFRPLYAMNLARDVQRDRRFYDPLISADSLFIDDLVQLGVTAREIREIGLRNPQRALSIMAKSAANFGKRFQQRMSKLFGNEAYVALQGLLLIEATRALAEAMEREYTLTATLELDCRGRRMVFTN